MTSTPIDGDSLHAVGSRPTMSAGTLAERVIAARSARRMTAGAMQRASGLSARTIRDIETGTPDRRYSAKTLGQLDHALGWPPGTAYNLWREDHDTSTVDAELMEIRRRLQMLEEEPAWARELVDLVRLLSAEDRYRMFDLLRRLADPPAR